MRDESEPLTWTSDVSAASWIAGRLHPFGTDVGAVVPVGFEAYARIFHPITTPEGRLRWSDIAKRNRRIAHPEMQLHMISTRAGQPSPKDYEPGNGPEWGTLAIEERRVLIDTLRSYTTAPDRCWFLVWEGFGGLDDRGVSARVYLPHRAYLLALGTIDSALSPLPRKIGPSYTVMYVRSDGRRGSAPPDLELPPDTRQSPNLWWPDDRAWIVATEIDFAWTYVGGSAALIESVLAEPRLEALPARITDRFTYNSDVVNAALD